MYKSAKYIPVDECEDRRLYKIMSRNLRYGVYRAESRGFIGIREKFGDRYLFEEYHWDNGPPFGTVHPQEATEHVLPNDILLDESTGNFCSKCNEPVQFIKDRPDDPECYTGHWEHLDGTRCEKSHCYSRGNRALFDWIEEHV
jgi:hypothetical protein